MDNSLIPTNELAEQWKATFWRGSSLISGAKRSTPDREYAQDVVESGYELASLSSWVRASGFKPVKDVPERVDDAQDVLSEVQDVQKPYIT